jgi:hypothetical protein
MQIASDGRISIGQGHNVAGPEDFTGSSFTKTGMFWGSKASTRVISYTDMFPQDNGMILLALFASNKLNPGKNAMRVIACVKKRGIGVTAVDVVNNNVGLGTWSYSFDGGTSDLTVNTDSDCAVTWSIITGAV